MKRQLFRFVFSRWRIAFSLIPVLIFGFSAEIYAERLSVSAPIANVRQGPGAKYDVIWKMERYYPVEIEEKKGDWLLFHDYESDQGWVHKKLLSKIPSVITKKDNCNVRAEADGKSKILFNVEVGIPFKFIKRKGDWINIQHADGDRGWIHKSLLW